MTDLKHIYIYIHYITSLSSIFPSFDLIFFLYLIILRKQQHIDFMASSISTDTNNVSITNIPFAHNYILRICRLQQCLTRVYRRRPNRRGCFQGTVKSISKWWSNLTYKFLTWGQCKSLAILIIWVKIFDPTSIINI